MSDLVLTFTNYSWCQRAILLKLTQFMGTTWVPPGSCRPQMGPMLAPWTLLSGQCKVWWFIWCLLYWVSLSLAIRRLNTKFREAAILGIKIVVRSEIWQTPRHHNCRVETPVKFYSDPTTLTHKRSFLWQPPILLHLHTMFINMLSISCSTCITL